MIDLFISYMLLLLLLHSLSQPVRGVLIDCGSNFRSSINGQEWLPDTGYISTGTSKTITARGQSQILSTVRTFPLQGNLFRKFCYEIPVNRAQKYLIRTTYYYGGVNVNGNRNLNLNPPVFDQIIDGIFWGVVNTTEAYMKGNSSYYEAIFMPKGKNLSVCLAANAYTDSDPFISALEVVVLLDQVYNSTDFNHYALNLIARNSFGHDGPGIRYPDDRFNRYWEPFGQDTFPQLSSQNLSVSGIWNLPPQKVFQTRLARSQPEPLRLMWPPNPLPVVVPPYNYSIALYFADDQISRSPRTFDITINRVDFYNNLTLTPSGVVIFANEWPLAGTTDITLSPAPQSTAGPLVNAGEVFQVIPAGERTLVRDAIAMVSLRNSFRNPPIDWKGDPCLPSRYLWTGVTCSQGPRIRITILNLMSIGLEGSISPSIAKLTALTTILLGNNTLHGTIPDLSSLKELAILHLEDNLINGILPPSLGNLTKLREIFVQNNNLSGDIPKTLVQIPGLTLRYTPGNPSIIPPPS
ncbi:probable LRR receptor-like serine/threonine-protein kinase At1g67720 [Andrographis paniculata]|uniref:probable LRR receptor-like serine/threonine-protein kinase At1g67720 n=1 Tax=Andrographis paniculata TaxID=175694 RepID=UPI0021E7DF73|nr:probable LRR receptor-like serine/threonine-protein kinase At1g67720 [Andrographis paniculata]